MSENANDFVTVKLSVPTVFADMNKASGKPEGHASTEVKVQRLKYKHFRSLQSVKDADQMHEALSKLTGLSYNDLDELDAEDAAEITSVVYGFMEKFMKLAGRMVSAVQRDK